MEWLLIITISITGLYGTGATTVKMKTDSEQSCKDLYRRYTKSKPDALGGQRLRSHGQCLMSIKNK